MTKILKFMNYWTALPSKSNHCCDCEGCDGKDKACRATLKRYCMVCKEKATIGYVLEDEDRKEKENHSGSVPFWVCGDHNEDPDVEKMLRTGIESSKVDWNTRMGYIMINEYQLPDEWKGDDKQWLFDHEKRREQTEKEGREGEGGKGEKHP